MNCKVFSYSTNKHTKNKKISILLRIILRYALIAYLIYFFAMRFYDYLIFGWSIILFMRIILYFVDSSIFQWKKQKWCHLVSVNLDSLHDFADSIGMKKEWFQCPPKASAPHYDLNEKRKEFAIKNGAILANRPTIIYYSKLLLLEWSILNNKSIETISLIENNIQKIRETHQDKILGINNISITL